MSDHKAGVLLLVSALFMQIAFNHSSLSKVLITDLGGHKRLKALSVIMSTLIIAPWAIFNLFTSVSIFIKIPPFFIFKNSKFNFFKVLDPSTYSSFSSESEIAQANHTWLYYLIPLVLMSLFIFVIDFYVNSYVASKTDSTYCAKYGTLFIFTCSVGLSFIWNHPHLVKVIVMDKIKTIIEQEHALSWGVIIAYILYMLGKF